MRSLKLFRRSFYFFLSLLLLCVAGLLSHFFFLTPDDFTQFAKLTEMKEGLESRTRRGEQTSKIVQKDLWVEQNGIRDHHVIRSKLSKLSFIPRDNHYEVIEKLEGLAGEMDGAKKRLFSASRGYYHYGSHEFLADTVALSVTHYENILLKGKASAMVLHLTDAKPVIAVEKLVADLPEKASDTMIESDRAHFDGANLKLRGKVFLNHALGKMWAQGANLYNYDTEKTALFSQVELETKVKLTFRNHGSMRCEKATIDVEKESGEMTSEKGEVYFTDTLGGKSVTGTSKKVEFAAIDHALETVTASDEVTLHLGDEYLLKCDEVTYNHSPTRKVLATGESCQIERDGDTLDGGEIAIDIEQNIVDIAGASGKVATTTIPLHFSAASMQWNHPAQTLTLEKDVWLLTDEGHLLCDGKALLEQKMACGKRVVARVWTEGKTWFHAESLSLFTPTTLHLNRETMEVSAYATEMAPLELTIGEVVAFAKEAHLDYRENGSERKISSAVADGEVYLKNADPDKPLKRAICDRLTYDPETGIMVLSSQKRDHVLYWDEEEEMEMCATEVHITRGGKAPLVSGIGKVRFRFTEEEKQWFSQQKI